MYFKDIRKLKNDLVADAVGESDAFRYLFFSTLGYLFAFTLISLTPKAPLNFWDLINELVTWALVGGGLFFVYKANGGARGRAFLLRYTSVGWVLMIRFLPLLLLTMIVNVGLMFIFNPGQFSDLGDSDASSNVVEPTTWMDVVPYACWTFLYYFRFARHLTDISQRGGTTAE
jgi:hypothetical protein